MCQPGALGGQRCVTHTRLTYRAHPTDLGSMTYYATTPEGHEDITAALNAANTAGHPTIAATLTLALELAELINSGDLTAANQAAADAGASFRWHPPHADNVTRPPVSTGDLNEYDRLLLDLEGGAYPQSNRRSKHDTAYVDFALMSTAYYQRLNALIDLPEAAEHAPNTVKRLRTVRENRFDRSRHTRSAAS